MLHQECLDLRFGGISRQELAVLLVGLFGKLMVWNVGRANLQIVCPEDFGHRMNPTKTVLAATITSACLLPSYPIPNRDLDIHGPEMVMGAMGAAWVGVVPDGCDRGFESSLASCRTFFARHRTRSSISSSAPDRSSVATSRRLPE